MNPLAAAALLVLLQLAPAEKASIEGIVLGSVNGEPLGRAQVKLARVITEDDDRSSGFFDGTDPATRGLPSVLTANDGKFLLKDLEPGQYRLSAIRNGYALRFYGQKSANGQGTIINLTAGEKLRNIEFRLVKAGNVTGRVRDSVGEPVAGLDVTLLRTDYGQTETSLWQTDNTRTDDRGEYRFYWIPPGRYYIRVSPSRGDLFSGARNVIADPTIVTSYYPGVLDPSSGSAIEIAAGTELAGVDIVLPRAIGSTIRGRLVDASTGKPPKSAGVGVSRKRPAPIRDYSDNSDSRSQYDPATGTFEIRNVVPGSYWLAATTSRGFNEPLPVNNLAEIRTGADIFDSMFSVGSSAQITIEMPSADLNDVVLTLKPGVTVPVRLSLEGTDFASVKGMEDVRVTLAPEVEGRSYRQSTRLNAEGVARIDNVMPGEYRAGVDQPKSTELYVKEILYGRTDALNEKVLIGDQTPNGISVLLSTKGGQVQGTLTDALAQPVSGVEVMLIPDDRDRTRLFRQTTTDRDGHFAFRAVPPGGFKVFSWEEAESNRYYDKEFLSKYETQGRPVQVQESSKLTVDLKIIPAPKP